MDRPLDEVPLTQAAHELRVSYLTARDMVLTGRLHGYQLASGRWLVSRGDVDRVRREREQNAGAVPA